MATVTQFYTIDKVAVAKVVVVADDCPQHFRILAKHARNLVSVYTETDEAITAITDHGIEDLSEMILDARRSPQEWHNFLEDFVSDPDIITCVKDKGLR